MSFLEKWFGQKRSPEKKAGDVINIEESLDYQIKRQEERIRNEKNAVLDLPDGIRSIRVKRLEEELKGLIAKRDLAWEKIGHEGGKITPEK